MRGTVLLLAGMLASGCSSGETSADLLLFTVDTLRFDHLALHGHPFARNHFRSSNLPLSAAALHASDIFPDSAVVAVNITGPQY